MKREELERWTVKKWVHSEWEIVRDENGEFFWVEDVNPVIDAMESRIKELKAENERLKAQVPKWHDLTKPLYTEDGVDYYDLPAEHGFYIVDCGGKECVQSEYDPDYNDWCDLLSTTKVLRWCEFPTTEESSATEKENG